MYEAREGRFRLLKERVLQFQRIAGIYILDCASVPRDAEQESFLRSFALRHGFAEPDVGEVEWRAAEVFREDAHQELTEILKGGNEIGHSRWDVPPADAAELAESFLSIFDDHARFFCSGIPVGEAQGLAPHARPDFSHYIFGGGCIAIDDSFAGILWVLDND